MISLLIVFFVLLCGSIIGSTLFNQRFEKTLPINCTFIVATLFFGGLLGFLKASVYFVISLEVLLSFLCLIHLFKHHALKDGLLAVFNQGFFVFAVIFVLLFLVHFGKLLHNWDEFSHWGDIVKVMTQINDFGTNPLSFSEFKDYPPGMALFQYFYQVAGFQNHFTEWFLYHSYQVYMLSFLFPFLAEFKIKKAGLCPLVIIPVILIPMLLYPNVYDTIYIDPFIGFVSGCALAFIFSSQSDSKYLSIYSTCSIATLVLAKDSGMLFACFMMLAFLIRLFTANHPSLILKQILSLILPLVGFLPKILWTSKIRNAGIVGQFSTKISITEVLSLALRQDTSYRADVQEQYFRALLTEKISVGDTGFFVTYFLLFILLFAAMIYIIHMEQALDSKGAKWWFWVVFAQTCTYLLGMCYIYAFKFAKSEALVLASFNRYVRVAFLSLLMCVTILILRLVLSHKEFKMRLLALCCIVLTLIPLSPLMCLLLRTNVSYSKEFRSRCADFSSKIEETVPGNAKVFYIAQGTDGLEYYMTHFNIRPRGIQYGTWSIAASPNNSGKDGTVIMPLEKWAATLKKEYDYVAIQIVDDQFVSDYSALFSDPRSISNGTIYQVNHGTGLLDYIA